MGWSASDVVGLVAALVPLVAALVQMIEKLMAGAPGAEKKAAAVKAITLFVGGDEVPLIGPMVDAEVAKFNADGTFVHGQRVDLVTRAGDDRGRPVDG